MKSRILRFCKRFILAFLILTIVPVLILRWVPPLSSSIMMQDWVGRLFDDRPARIKYQWMPLEEISSSMQLAVVAAEDQKFPDHWGFDLESMLSAFQHNQDSRRIRGASTISQQVAKNLFLWPGRSYLRKGLEAYFTLLIELLWSKERILEVYLNVAEFGDGVYGVEAAAQNYYRKSAVRLNRQEASIFAAVLPNPKRYLVQRPTGYVLQRARWIRQQMDNLGAGYLSF